MLKKTEMIKVCSKCGSTNIITVPMGYGDIRGISDVCQDCMVKHGPDIIQSNTPKIIEIPKSKLSEYLKKIKKS